MSAVLTVQEPGAQTLVQEPQQQAPLLRDFDVIAQAPGGVVRLRELILTLAVQGKLVPQDARDEPASVLLKKIRAEKDRLIAEGKIKRDKPLAEIAEEENPFELAKGWEWVRFGDLALISSGVTLGRKISIASPVSLPYLRVANVQRWHVNLTSVKEVVIDRSELGRFQLVNGDLLITEGGDWDKVGRTTIWRDELPTCLHQNHIFKARGASSEWSPLWAQLFLNSPVARAYFAFSAKQTTNLASINMAELKACVFPLPPLPEQSRIVTRVEELMLLCDALEAKGRLEAAQHEQLVNTLLATLTDSDTPEQLTENWQRIATHFDLLLDRPQAVDALEQTILQLAVRGLLVPQDPQEEPASELLKKIRSEKDRLIAQGQIKRDKPLPPIAEDDQPFTLPSGWELIPIETLADVGTGTTPSRDNAAFFSGGSIPWVTSGETGKAFIAEAAQHITEHALSQTSLSVYPVGTLIVAMYGQGKTRGQVSELQIQAATNQACAAIVLVEPSLAHRSFIKLVFEKSYDEIRELSAGGAQPNLNVGKIKATLIPLPPLAEQSRIVTRVTALRGLCANLRARLIASQSTQAKLAEAMIGEAVPA